MSEFDYIRAWYQAAKPAWETLQQDPRVTELYRMVADRADLAQDRVTLAVPSPSSDFDKLAESVEVGVLARASCACYHYGHWSPFGHSSPHGAMWKLSNILDQHVSARIGAKPPHQDNGSGISFRVHQGVIRVCVNTPHSWTWQEITYADVDTFKAIQAEGRPIAPGSLRFHKNANEYVDRCDKYMDRLQAKYRDTSEVFGPLLATERFMHKAEDALHLTAIRPDGKKQSKLTGMSSDLDVCKRMLAESNVRTIAGKEPLPDGTVLLIGTYPEGKEWKGDMQVVYAYVLGESVDMPDAISRGHEYLAQAEIDKAQRTMDKAKEQLVVLRGAK